MEWWGERFSEPRRTRGRTLTISQCVWNNFSSPAVLLKLLFPAERNTAGLDFKQGDRAIFIHGEGVVLSAACWYPSVTHWYSPTPLTIRRTHVQYTHRNGYETHNLTCNPSLLLYPHPNKHCRIVASKF
jgi:hypothetical protein